MTLQAVIAPWMLLNVFCTLVTKTKVLRSLGTLVPECWALTFRVYNISLILADFLTLFCT
jgi:hypothetical protein